MEGSEERPSPEELLQAIRLAEGKTRRGRLKIFLGMAAGVGKTYAMLEEAQRLQQEGIDLVVGIVNAHGREETERLVDGLTILPLKEITYKERTFQEFDIEGVLKRKPQLVLVDELAHTNIPGSRHTKRWQDVVEILDSGIDVLTTLNIQHIESLKDMVEGVVEISIRETVPDLIVETAASIEVVDITPEGLLERLKEGKVYLGDQSRVAALHFFQEDRLTALREMVLRYSAEKVDHDLRWMVDTIGRPGAWRTRERLLVAVSHSTYAQKLIRTTRRLAFTLGAPWIALHVDDGRDLSDLERAQLAKNLSLARELGAEVITTHDSDLPDAVQRVARRRHVTQIVIGQPFRRSILGIFYRHDLLDRLARECGDIDVHVIGHEPSRPIRKRVWRFEHIREQWISYLTAYALVFLLMVASWFLLPVVGYRIVGFGFLLGILVLSLFLRKGPIFLAAILFALIWYVLFVPSMGSLGGISSEDRGLMILYLCTALVTSVLIDRERRQKTLLLKREETTSALYDIVKNIASSPSIRDTIRRVKNRLETILNGSCDIYLRRENNGLVFDTRQAIANDEKEQTVANWVFANAKEAGWSTDTLPMAKNLYLPLQGTNEIAGVLSYHSESGVELLPEEKNLLYTVGGQIASHIERASLETKQRRLEQLQKMDSAYRSLLDLILNRLYSPLRIIQEALFDSKHESSGEKRKRSLDRVESSVAWLMREIGSIQAISRFSSGEVVLNKRPCDLRTLVRGWCESIEQSKNGHAIEIDMQDSLPRIFFDQTLMEILFCSLLLNACEQSSVGSAIKIGAVVRGNTVALSIAYQGHAIPQDMQHALAEKFPPLFDVFLWDLGLSLAIAKAIAELHGGILQAENLPDGWVQFSVFLPIK